MTFTASDDKAVIRYGIIYYYQWQLLL
jgi:hypothetical protein